LDVAEARRPANGRGSLRAAPTRHPARGARRPAALRIPNAAPREHPRPAHQVRLTRPSCFTWDLLETAKRRTVANAPRSAENRAEQSARVERRPADFTSAGKRGASRSCGTKRERRSIDRIGVLVARSGQAAPAGQRSEERTSELQ